MLSSLNTLPMGADLRVVIIENAGKLPKPVSEAVIEYLKAPNESCTLLLVAETLAKSTRLYKAVAKVGPLVRHRVRCPRSGVTSRPTCRSSRRPMASGLTPTPRPSS